MVSDVILRDSVVRNVLDALARRVSKTREIYSYDSLDVFIVDSPDDLFNEIVSAAKQYATDVVSEFDNPEDRKEAAIILRYLATWAPEARTYLRTPPSEVVSALKDYILYRIGASNVEPKLEAGAIMKLARYLPLRVSKGDKDYYVIAPTFREPELANIDDIVFRALRRVYLTFFDKLEYDPYTQTVMLGGKTLLQIHDERSFVESIIKEFSGTALYSKIIRGVQRKYAEALKKSVEGVLAFDSEEVADYAARLTKRTTTTVLAQILGVKIPEEMHDRNLELRIGLSAASWMVYAIFEVEGRIVDYVDVPYSVPLHEAETFGAKLPEMFASAMESVVRWERLARVLKNKLHEAGFRLNSTDTSTIEYVLNRESCRIVVEAEYIVGENGSLAIDVTVRYHDILDKENVERVLKQYGYIDGLAKFPETGLLRDWTRGVTELYWRGIVLQSEDAIAEFVDKLAKLSTVLAEAKQERVPPRKVAELDENNSVAAYLILLFDPADFHFDINTVLHNVKQRLMQADVRDVLSEDVKKALLDGKDEVLIIEGEKIVSKLLEKEKLKISDSKIQLGASTVDFKELGFSDEEVKEVLTRIVSGITMSGDMNAAAKVWCTLSAEAKKTYIEKLPGNVLVRILASDYLSSMFSDVSQAILNRAKHGDPILKTLAYCRFSKDILGTKMISITTEPGVPAINAGMFYVHVYNVGGGYVDYLVYGKSEKVGVVYRGRTLREALSKALKTYDSAVRSASWVESTVTLGSLRIPLKDGKPIRGDEAEEESALVVQ